MELSAFYESASALRRCEALLTLVQTPDPSGTPDALYIQAASASMLRVLSPLSGAAARLYEELTSPGPIGGERLYRGAFHAFYDRLRCLCIVHAAMGKTTWLWQLSYGQDVVASTRVAVPAITDSPLHWRLRTIRSLNQELDFMARRDMAAACARRNDYLVDVPIPANMREFADGLDAETSGNLRAYVHMQAQLAHPTP